MAVRGIIFDLDGTLLDTLEDLADAVNVVLDNNGFPSHSLDEYRYLVGQGAFRLMTDAAGLSDDDERIPALLKQFSDAYARNWHSKTAPYIGIGSMLEGLSDRGVCMAVYSNKPHDFTVTCVGHYFPDIDFHDIRGVSATTPPKPDPTGGRDILASMGFEARDCLFVGDSVNDMRTAVQLGIRAIGVAWGFRPVTELKESGADIVIHSPTELLNLL